jgi:hypothetical protein
MSDPVAEPASRETSPAQAPPQSENAGAEGQAASPSAANSAFARALENSEYFLDIGPGLTISADLLRAQVDLSQMRQILPGVQLKRLSYNRANSTATISGDLNIPHLRTRNRDLRISVNGQGQTTLNATLVSDLPIFKNKSLAVSLDEQRMLSATLTIEPSDMMPRRGADNLSVVGAGSFTLQGGKLSGNVEADLHYEQLGSGHVSFSFSPEGRASGSGNFDFEADFLRGASASLEIDEEANLKAQVNIPVSDIDTHISGLSVTEGTLSFTMNNSTPGGAIAGLKLVYNGLGEAVLDARIRDGKFSGNGRFNVTLAELTDVHGRLNFERGVLTGDVTIRSSHFPRSLRVESGSITGTLQASGDIDLSGEATINLGPAGTGQLRASKEDQVIRIGATITLENIPGLQSGEFSVEFTNLGGIEGEGELATDDSLIPGLSGRLKVSYRENLWSGETEITYTQENPSVNGSVTVGIHQSEEGVLLFYGNGELTAEVIPGVEGNATVAIDEEGKVLLTFAITQTEPYELFPERRQEKEFLNITQNIPLFAGIVVAVIRIRAGARAGIGPGQIRNSRIEGEWEITSDEPPNMTVSTEFFMPAFVEGYVAFGAGLGVDVLLGSLTGGIEAMATAGLYGAVSVVPELSYENGDWMFDGTATLAAGARLKLSLNAWAEIEALWITVWERTWELASHTMNIGPDLVLSAGISMNLSNPSVPEITYEASDVDHAGLIDSAMPEDGPPGAGTREAVENRAQWQGATREAGQGADSVPPELAGQANQTEAAPAAPSRPAPQARPTGEEAGQAASPSGQQNGGRPGETGAPQASQPRNSANNRNQTTPRSTATEVNPASSGATNAPNTKAASNQGTSENNNQSAQTNAPRQGAVPDSQVPSTDQARYPRTVSLETLNEPPAAMPRNAAQQREDLNAAAQVLNLASAQSEDSEQLASYFARMQRRFQLTRIGYVEEGEDTVVEILINPSLTKHRRLLRMKGRGLGGVSTQIIYRTGRIADSSDTVGREMEAKILGPDHPLGSGPKGQDDLRLRLRREGDSRNKFVRGHLLNDNVGGSGDPKNLFPITAKANNDHERLVENKIKTWVNQGYWMTYKVTADYKDSKLDDPDINSNYVTANFICSAAILDLDHNRVLSNRINETIVSKVAFAGDQRSTERNEQPDDSTKQRLPDIRAIDASAQLNTQLERELGKTLNKHTLTSVSSAIQAVSGMANLVTLLMHAYTLAQSDRLIGPHLSTQEKQQLIIVNGMSRILIDKLKSL